MCAPDVAPEVSITWVRIFARQVVFDQLFTKLPLHKTVGGDHAHIACLIAFWPESQIKEALGKGHTQGILDDDRSGYLSR